MSKFNVQHKNFAVGADGGTAVAQGAKLRCPSDLPPKVRAIWRRTVPKLQDAGILADVDASQLRNYCVAQARLEKLQLDILGQPEYVENDKGALVKHPAADLIHQLTVQVNRFAAEFGLTVRARAILGDSLRNGKDRKPEPKPETRGVDRPKPKGPLRAVS